MILPRLARTLMVSTVARDHSTSPSTPSRSSTSRWSWSNTPALAHSVSRRQHVAGEPQPSSVAGSSRHGVDVRTMYTIAAKQLRSGIVRRRPPYQARGGNGRSGSTIAHSSSGTRSSTMVDMTVKPPILPRGQRNAVLAIDLPNESSARVRSPQIPYSTKARPRTAGRAVGADYWGSSGRTLAAWAPLGPDVTSNSTTCPSSSER